MNLPKIQRRSYLRVQILEASFNGVRLKLVGVRRLNDLRGDFNFSSPYFRLLYTLPNWVQELSSGQPFTKSLKIITF